MADFPKLLSGAELSGDACSLKVEERRKPPATKNSFDQHWPEKTLRSRDGGKASVHVPAARRAHRGVWTVGASAKNTPRGLTRDDARGLASAQRRRAGRNRALVFRALSEFCPHHDRMHSCAISEQHHSAEMRENVRDPRSFGHHREGQRPLG